MTKKVLLALTLMVTALFATNSFGQACSSGVLAQFVAGGSSAQFNSFAYAAHVGLALPNFWSTKSGQLQDTRFSPPTIDSGLTAFAAWDNNNLCNLYVYFNVDSGIGVKNFFATAKSVSPGKGVYGAVYGVSGSWTSAAGAKAIPGIDDSATTLPTNIQTFLTTSPAPTTANQIPQPGCGQIGIISGTTIYCWITAGPTDIRPEDALYATTRALGAYSTTNGLAGLGYNQGSGGVGGCNAFSNNQGCAITDSFNQGKVFNVLNFKLTGTDPVTTASVPVYTTLSTGAAPLLVLASNADTGTLGLGSTSSGNYVFNNINKAILSSVFQGVMSCTGDLLPSPQGSGQPLDIIHREPLSGTYNAWEFTAVRTLAGSAATTVKQSQISTKTWQSDDSSGQEFDPYGNLPLGPATNFGNSACNPTGGPNGTIPCGDPLYNPLGTCGTGTVQAFKARGVGTGEEVKATLGLDNTASLIVNDGIGYSFWSYQNFAPTAKTCTTGVSGDVSCATYLGHYLTVDGIDPLFPNAGTPVDTSGTTIPGGAYNFPQCGVVQNTISMNSFPCQQIPFTHVFDGTYPLWSQLRVVTFANVTNKQVTPGGAINLFAAAETEAADPAFQLSDFVPLLKNVTGSYSQGLGGVTTSGTHVTWVSGDPFNTSWTGPVEINGVVYTITAVSSTTSMTVTPAPPTHATVVPYDWNGGTPPKGDLNLGVFRSHYLQSAINPYNGHVQCGSYTGILIVGGTGTVGNTCLVDLGGDMGGSVFTVQSDVDFNADFGGVGVNPNEVYGLHQ